MVFHPVALAFWFISRSQPRLALLLIMSFKSMHVTLLIQPKHGATVTAEPYSQSGPQMVIQLVKATIAP